MCTTLCFKKNGDMIVGNNLDMFTDIGYAFTNQGNLKKVALLMPTEKPLTWVSKYGSITFNQAGKESPNGGMNEKGVVIEQMTLPETTYPEIDDTPGIGNLQWIQYMLDSCSSAKEVLKLAQEVRISRNSAARLHYLICDRYGDIVIIEYIDGEITVYTGESLPYSILTNNKYKDSLRFIDNDKEFKYDINNDYLCNSLERFKKSERELKKVNSTTLTSVQYGFKILEDVSREDTVWSKVYDINKLTIYFKTKNYPHIKNISLKNFDFSNKKNGKVLNINIEGKGNIDREFVDYNTIINRQLIYSFYRNEIFIDALNMNLSDEILEYLAKYPEQMIRIEN